MVLSIYSSLATSTLLTLNRVGQSQISQQFCNLKFDIGLDQLISLPTHNIKGNTLDLLLTNIEDNIDSIKVHSDPLLFPSDHYSITFNL